MRKLSNGNKEATRRQSVSIKPPTNHSQTLLVIVSVCSFIHSFIHSYLWDRTTVHPSSESEPPIESAADIAWKSDCTWHSKTPTIRPLDCRRLASRVVAFYTPGSEQGMDLRAMAKARDERRTGAVVEFDWRAGLKRHEMSF